jgi:hypothetical protein
LKFAQKNCTKSPDAVALNKEMATRYDTSRFSGDVSALKLPANLLPLPPAFNLIPIGQPTTAPPPPTETESNKWFWAWLTMGSLVLLVGILAIVSLHGERIEVGDRRKPVAAGADTAASCTLDEVTKNFFYSLV